MAPTLDKALESLRNGRFVILVDDEDRENEGDLVLAAEFVTPEAVNFMAKNGRGLICLSLEAQRVEELQLPMMTPGTNRSQRQTAFTVSIEARHGVSTGISAADRAHTIRTVIDPAKTAQDLISPGHVFPLRAVEGGVLVRTGHTEGSIDLVRMAGLRPAAVICEVMNDDGTMARRQDLEAFAKHHGSLQGNLQGGESGEIPIITIDQIVSYRFSKECLVRQVASSQFPTPFGEFEMHAFQSLVDGSEHLALVKGDLGENPSLPPPLVRVHSECLTGDSLFSLRCDCGYQLAAALRTLSEQPRGVLVYMRRHEGRGIGLTNKIRAYALQDQGIDTVEANRHLGFKADLRHYGIGAQILRSLGIRQLKLLTNNPKKMVGLGGYGLEILEQLPIEMEPTSFNLSYLRTKRDKLGHHILLNEIGNKL